MNARQFLELQEAYQGVYQELDEVRGGGRIDPVSDFPHHGERARSSKDAGLKMSPLDRAEARANALKKRNDPEATKRANRISSRFIGPTKRGIGRAIDASNAARSAEKKRLMNPQESYEYDTFDAILEHLVAKGYADTNENAIAIMANMSEEWREEILDENRMDKELNTPNWDKVYDRNERDFPNHTRKPERKPSGKLETPNQTTKRVGKGRVQSHKDTRGVKQIPGAKGVRMQFGRAF